MKYEIWWNGECIDETDTIADARYLRTEYQMAFGSEHRVTIKKVRAFQCSECNCTYSSSEDAKGCCVSSPIYGEVICGSCGADR
jgi:hypothetical protein